MLHEVWLRVSSAAPGPVASPLAYLFRTADLLLIDRHRSVSRASRRDRDWSDLNAGDGRGVSVEPSAERTVAARQTAAEVLAELDSLGPRVARVFRRHRIDGIAQRQVAEELGVSLSTVESDLRSAYRALREWKERRDEV